MFSLLVLLGLYAVVSCQQFPVEYTIQDSEEDELHNRRQNDIILRYEGSCHGQKFSDEFDEDEDDDEDKKSKSFHCALHASSQLMFTRIRPTGYPFTWVQDLPGAVSTIRMNATISKKGVILDKADLTFGMKGDHHSHLRLKGVGKLLKKLPAYCVVVEYKVLSDRRMGKSGIFHLWLCEEDRHRQEHGKTSVKVRGFVSGFLVDRERSEFADWIE